MWVVARAEDGIRDGHVTGVQTCALPIYDRVGRAQVNPVLGRVAVELQEHVEVVGDLGDRLGVLGAVVELERFDRDLGVVEVLGVVDLLERSEERRVGKGGGCGWWREQKTAYEMAT